MYGMVNAGVEDLARRLGGDEAWARIKEVAEVEERVFIGLRTYDDHITYRLVGAASEVLGLAPEEVLVAFGRHWVRYTARAGWGPLLDAAGGDLATFLLGLDGLHARVGLTMPSLQPPSFSCTEVAEDSLRLHYRSPREGLAAMVVGLLRGLGEHFGVDVDVEHDVDRSDGADHDEFLVRWVAPAAPDAPGTPPAAPAVLGPAVRAAETGPATDPATGRTKGPATGRTKGPVTGHMTGRMTGHVTDGTSSATS